MTRTERFKAAADSLGLRQQPLAELLGIRSGQSYISTIMAGRAEPSEQLTRHVEAQADLQRVLKAEADRAVKRMLGR
ncbi:MAG: hypothetical protein CMK74_12350 [Pseudomonadales bacterium]|jgi:transcriptional regulator with XRE-family HTH domain|nr:hypothetical protein [Pseudomonadales bacterium]|tara:strand:+ start:139 stop:369 length:231 start_codon:yes stop_codon:yes gene_type:complete